MLGDDASTSDQRYARCAQLALEGIPRRHPYHLTLVVREEGDLAPPARVHPVFHGCFDWHSAVHSHWLLVRVLRVLGGTDLADRSQALLERQFDAEALRAEADHLCRNPAFERPYGLAWVLALSHEVALLGGVCGTDWQDRLQPLVEASVANLVTWLEKLGTPMRTGTHNQTAFALTLVYDWACATGRPQVAGVCTRHAVDFFGADRDYPLHLEPGGEDFVSASLGACALMTRLMEPTSFAGWLDRVLPGIRTGGLPEPVEPADRTDGRLTHLDGLNLSRAWMLHDVAGALPEGDPRIESIIECAHRHEVPGFASLALCGYEGGHWLGSFAGYLLGRRPASV